MDNPSERSPDPAPDPSPLASDQARLDAAEAADDETRLKVLEDLYRSLESGLEGSDNPSQP